MRCRCYSGAMRRLLATLLVLVCGAAPSAADDLITLKRKVLANGVTVLVWERPSAGRVGTRMFYRVDVAAERPGTIGLTHMLEHFLFKGSDLAGRPTGRPRRRLPSASSGSSVR